MTSEERLKRSLLDELAAENELQLGAITFEIREEFFPYSTPKEQRRIAMDLIRELHEEGLVRAGYEPEPWPGTIEEVLQRVEREWSKDSDGAEFAIFFHDLRKPPARRKGQ